MDYVKSLRNRNNKQLIDITYQTDSVSDSNTFVKRGVGMRESFLSKFLCSIKQYLGLVKRAPVIDSWVENAEEIIDKKDVSPSREVKLYNGNKLKNENGWETLEPKQLRKMPFMIAIVVVSLPFAVWIISAIVGAFQIDENEAVWANTTRQNTILSLGRISLGNVDNELRVECEADYRSAYVVNIDTGKVMYSYNATTPVAIASITKLVTAFVSMDYYVGDELLSIKKDRQYFYSEIGLGSGEYMRADDLVKALLVYSANDAAYILSDNYPGGQEEFVKKMNIFASNLGLTYTRFVNPVGLDDLGHLSTAEEVAIIFSVALRNKKTRNILALDNISLPVYTEKAEFIREVSLTNRDDLLLENIVRGGKTGFTDEAGQCLVSYIEDNGNAIVFVILGADDRFLATKCLIKEYFMQ